MYKRQASDNAQDGISLIQTAEGALNEAPSILQRMNELSVQGANDTNQNIDRDAINQELTALTKELDRISETTPVSYTHLDVYKRQGARTVDENLKQDVGQLENYIELMFHISIQQHAMNPVKEGSVYTLSLIHIYLCTLQSDAGAAFPDAYAGGRLR